MQIKLVYLTIKGEQKLSRNSKRLSQGDAVKAIRISCSRLVDRKFISGKPVQGLREEKSRLVCRDVALAPSGCTP